MITTVPNSNQHSCIAINGINPIRCYYMLMVDEQLYQSKLTNPTESSIILVFDFDYLFHQLLTTIR